MIKPHVDKILIIQGKKWDNAPLEHIESEPDKPELFKKFFPDIEVIEDRTTKFCADLYNQGMERLQEYDLVTRLDADFFMTKSDCARLFDFFKETTGRCYRLNFRTSSINYYHDFYHGAKDQSEIDPLAVDPREMYKGFLDYSGESYMIRWEDFALHHLRQVKGNPIVKEWLDGGLPYPFSVYASEIKRQYTPGEWYELPKELINLITLWKNKLEK